MEKSADAYRTISEVAEDLVLPQHVLRFWETRFPQIRPLKRAGGRRYYRPADIVVLRSIRQLLYDEGYTIKGVQRLLKEQTGRGLRNADASLGPAVQVALLADRGDDVRDDLPDDTVESAPGFSASPASDLHEALALVEECERILAALRRPA